MPKGTICKLCGYLRPAFVMNADRCQGQSECMARRVRRFKGRAGQFSTEYKPPTGRAMTHHRRAWRH